MEYYSVSRLKTYRTCSMKYRYEYVDKVGVHSSSKSTTIGSIVHNALEMFYLTPPDKRQRLLHYFDDAFTLFIKESGMEKAIDSTVMGMLNSYSKGMSTLLERSSPGYMGNDAIRKRDGTPASNPSMTSEWKNSYQKLGLESTHQCLCLYLDGTISLSGEDFIDAYSEAKHLCSNYKGSSYLTNALEVEMPISKKTSTGVLNPVFMPTKHGGRKNIYLLGFIDLVSELDDGSLALVDHKTSMSAFTGTDIKYNAQLLAYCYAYEKIRGVRPHYIGINNIRSGDVVLVDTPPVKEAMEVLDSLFSCHKLINDGVWMKHSPEPYSPCLAMYGSSCPYLNKCWPNYSLN